MIVIAMDFLSDGITPLTCLDVNCYRKVVAHSLCDAHYRQWYRKQKPLYATWLNMKTRCYNDHYRYGKVKVCARWLHSYEAFAADMGERPPGHRLVRIDPAGDYEPDNCMWAQRRRGAPV